MFANILGIIIGNLFCNKFNGKFVINSILN